MKYLVSLLLITLCLQIKTVSAYTSSETVEVNLIWNKNQGVLVEIGDHSFTMRANQQRVVELPHSEALKVQIVTPGATFEAEEFLILDESETNIIQIYMENGSVKIANDNQLKSTADESLITAGSDNNKEATATSELSDRTGDISINKHNYLFTLLVSEKVSGESWALDYSYRQMRLRNESDMGNSEVSHGIVFNGGFRMVYTGGEIGYLGIPFDVGAGYGFTFGDFSSSATMNIVIGMFSAIRVYNSELAEFMDDENNFDFFPSNSGFIRFANVWEPFQNRSDWLSQLGFSAKLNVGLSGGSSFTIGLSTDRLF
jgi:hypothetical protein